MMNHSPAEDHSQPTSSELARLRPRKACAPAHGALVAPLTLRCGVEPVQSVAPQSINAAQLAGSRVARANIRITINVGTSM
jgi:hypothetical protein